MSSSEGMQSYQNFSQSKHVWRSENTSDVLLPCGFQKFSCFVVSKVATELSIHVFNSLWNNVCHRQENMHELEQSLLSTSLGTKSPGGLSATGGNGSCHLCYFCFDFCLFVIQDIFVFLFVIFLFLCFLFKKKKDKYWYIASFASLNEY